MVDYRFFYGRRSTFFVKERNMIPDEYVIYLEILGYIGTALIILSMMMSSVVKLRIFNVCGSVISAVYAILSVGYPVALLNLALTVINVTQLIKHYRAERANAVQGEDE